ncbi:hypothetical protein FMR86_00870 [Desulfovibrio sp. JC010]|nr:hypothetical protein [Desulfovibrio sp. JC010]
MDLLEHSGSKRIRTDEDIIKILGLSAQELYDSPQKAKKNKYVWSIRDVKHFPSGVAAMSEIVLFKLIKSLTEKEGVIVTRNTTEEGISRTHPPSADAIAHIIVHMGRHLVAIENVHQITNSDAWKTNFYNISNKASTNNGYCSYLDFEDKPSADEIFKEFSLFEKITRLKIALRLPNPEWNMATKALYEKLKKGNIREYMQDMKSPTGLSKEITELPYASLAMAQLGYKDGTVTLEGVKDGKLDKKITGAKAEIRHIDMEKSLTSSMLNSTGNSQLRAVQAICENLEQVDNENNK